MIWLHPSKRNVSPHIRLILNRIVLFLLILGIFWLIPFNTRTQLDSSVSSNEFVTFPFSSRHVFGKARSRRPESYSVHPFSGRRNIIYLYRKGKPIVRWGRKVMGLCTVYRLPDCRRNYFFGSFYFTVRLERRSISRKSFEPPLALVYIHIIQRRKINA